MRVKKQNIEIIPATPIEIFGKELTLRFKAQGIMEVEQKTGLSFIREASTIFRQLSVGTLITLLAAGLKYDLPNVTETEIAADIDFEDVPYYIEQVVAAFQRAFPKEKQVEAVKAAEIGSGKVVEMVLDQETTLPTQGPDRQAI